MTVSELFRGLLTHVVFFIKFFSTRGVNRNFQFSNSEWSVRYLKRTKVVNAKGSNGHYRSWCQ